MAGNTVEGHNDHEFVSECITRVNALATWAISIGHHCLFHSPWVGCNRSMAGGRNEETKALILRVKNGDRINTMKIYNSTKNADMKTFK